MSNDDWTVLDSEELFAARPHVLVTRERVRTSRGQIIDDFYRVELAPFALCVPQLPTGRIVTLWSYKHGPRGYGLSFPAGYLSEGEEAETACRRELLEETGYAAHSLIPLGTFIDNGNQCGSTGSYFFAAQCQRVALPDSGDLEEMEVRLMKPSAIDQAIACGEMPVIHHVAAWGLARRHIT
jgi:ADP-ribose pyrophosphatase